MKRLLKRLFILALVAAVGLVAFAAVTSYMRRLRPAETPLAKAAAAGDAEAIRARAAGGDVNAREHGLTPLMFAARSGGAGAVNALLDAGADPNLRDCTGRGWTPLMHALHRGQNAAARALVERGADVNARAGGCHERLPEGDMTPLMHAALYDNEEMVRFLLERGADPRLMRGDDNALSYAVGGASLGRLADIDRAATHPCPAGTVKALLERAPDLRIPDGVLDRTTFYVARAKCPEVARLLEGRMDANPQRDSPAGGSAATRPVANN